MVVAQERVTGHDPDAGNGSKLDGQDPSDPMASWPWEPRTRRRAILVMTQGAQSNVVLLGEQGIRCVAPTGQGSARACEVLLPCNSLRGVQIVQRASHFAKSPIDLIIYIGARLHLEPETSIPSSRLFESLGSPFFSLGCENHVWIMVANASTCGHGIE